MNTKMLTMKNRIRKAWQVLTGKPRDSIEIGLTVKRCDECDRGKTCEYKPRPGAYTRINCPLWEKEAEKS